jgi:hypothetical protein
MRGALARPCAARSSFYSLDFALKGAFASVPCQLQLLVICLLKSFNYLLQFALDGLRYAL